MYSSYYEINRIAKVSEFLLLKIHSTRDNEIKIIQIQKTKKPNDFFRVENSRTKILGSVSR